MWNKQRSMQYSAVLLEQSRNQIRGRDIKKRVGNFSPQYSCIFGEEDF